MGQVCIATTALAFLPPALGAEEVQFGVRSGVAWSTNVLNVPEDDPEDPTSDFSARVSPFVSAADSEGDLTWGLRYQPTYEGYLHESDLDGFDHDVSGSLSWRFADRWVLSLREAYGIYQNSIRFNEIVGPGQEATLGFRNQEIRAHRTGVTLQHSLSPRNTLTLSANFNSFEYPDGGGNDRSVPSAALFYQHVLSERTKLGTRFSWTQQTFDRAGGGRDETQFYNLAGTLEYRFSPTLRLEAAAGPTFVDSSPATDFETFQFALSGRRFELLGVLRGPFTFDADQCQVDGVVGRARNFNSDCRFTSDQEITEEELVTLAKLTAKVPTVDQDGLLIDSSDASGTDLTYFARLALVKDWENWNGTLSYDRSNSENARFGSSSVADTLTAMLNWRPRRFWTFGLVAAVSLQEQTADQVVPVAFQLENVPAPAGVTSVTELAEIRNIIASTQTNAENYRTQSLSFSVDRQLTRSASVFATVYWYSARQDGGFGGDERWNNLVLWVGFDWTFDPIRF